MLPHEVQATMAKILFLVFATFVLCFGKARAFDNFDGLNQVQPYNHKQLSR